MSFPRSLVTVAGAMAVALALAGTALGTNGTITGITPGSGPTAGGTTVTIDGTWLWGAFGPAVTIGGVTAPIVSQSGFAGSPEQIVVTTPAHAAGAADVVVSEYGTETARVNGGFVYVAPTPPAPSGPTITVTGVVAASGLTTGGQVVTVTGSGFSGGATPTVTLGGTEATDVSVASDTSLTATTPEHAAGAVDVAVSHDGVTGSKASAYTYDQGYWLTITNTQPPGLGPASADSVGAVRTPAAGTWGTVSKGGGLLYHWSKSEAYAGGINCGNRRDAWMLIRGFFGHDNTWQGGACRFGFAAGTSVALSALPSSYFALIGLEQTVGGLNRWQGDCSGSTGGTCTVTMSKDRKAGAVWGASHSGFESAPGSGRARLALVQMTPTFAADGSVTYVKAGLYLTAGSDPSSSGYTVSFEFAAMTANETAVRRRVACVAPARVMGRHLVGGCTVTPALAAALGRGPVRLTMRWYLTPPKSTSRFQVAQSRGVLRNRRAVTVVTG